MSQKKDTTTPVLTRSAQCVARLLFRFPSRTFHLRELSREAGVSKVATSAALRALKASGIAEITQGTATTDVRADVESLEYRHSKLLFNLRQVFSSGAIGALRDGLQPKAIVLFGSFARGEDFEQSDIDLCILSNRKLNEPARAALRALEKRAERKVNLHVLPSLARSDPAFKNALANGIVLHGYLELL